MSVMVVVSQCLSVTPPVADGVEGSIEDSADEVMGQLVVLSETPKSHVLDAEVYSDLDAGTVTLTVTVDADDLGDGVSRAIVAMRTAIHAAGDATPGWPTDAELREIIGKRNASAELVSVSDG